MKKQAFVELLKVISFSLLICIVTALLCLLQHVIENKDITVCSKEQINTSITVIIDAGHGGADGGAVGVTGVLEKDINLAISKQLESMFRLCGINTVMTRNDDRLLYKEGQESRKKFYDLKNRTDLVNSYENAILISIHQNKFPIEKYSGLQVYYSQNEKDSEKIAGLIQSKTAQHLQPENKREIKKAGRNIYILNNAKLPAVLVECGFLSNGREEANLSDINYQKKIAAVIFSAVTEYIYIENEAIT